MKSMAKWSLQSLISKEKLTALQPFVGLFSVTESYIDIKWSGPRSFLSPD